MAEVITRSVALPFQGGTPYTVQPRQSAIQLTPTRMVWTTAQSGPDWRFFTIIDTPEGWANGGTPVVTATQMFDQAIYGEKNTQMFRLNDNTFAIAHTGTNHQWKIEIFEIDQDNFITKVYTNVNPQGGFTSAFIVSQVDSLPGSTTKFANPVIFMPIVDNKVLQVYCEYTRIVQNTVTWNPVAKTLTSSSSTVLNAGVPFNNALEMYWKPIPGSTKKLVCCHAQNVLGTWQGADQQSTMAWVFNADGTLSSTVGATGNDFKAQIGGGSTHYIYDMTAMSETRVARLNWSNAYYYGIDGITNQGTTSFTGTTSPRAMMAYALDANYNLLIDRTHFFTPASTSLAMKVIRRDDSGISSQSTASAASATGFSVTAPYIDVWRHDPRPRFMENGNLFWWGLDATGTKLVWNILKMQAPA